VQPRPNQSIDEVLISSGLSEPLTAVCNNPAVRAHSAPDRPTTAKVKALRAELRFTRLPWVIIYCLHFSKTRPLCAKTSAGAADRHDVRAGETGAVMWSKVDAEPEGTTAALGLVRIR